MPSVVTAARSVNVALFLSNALRRDVSLALGLEHGTHLDIVTFPGDTLRRVSPDERSITFFLLKAITELENIEQQGRITMDNGIIVQKTTVQDYMRPWEGTIFLARSDSTVNPTPVVNVDSLYIYEVGVETDFQTMKISGIKKPRTAERFVLDINMIYDNRE